MYPYSQRNALGVILMPISKVLLAMNGPAASVTKTRKQAIFLLRKCLPKKVLELIYYVFNLMMVAFAVDRILRPVDLDNPGESDSISQVDIDNGAEIPRPASPMQGKKLEFYLVFYVRSANL